MLAGLRQTNMIGNWIIDSDASVDTERRNLVNTVSMSPFMTNGATTPSWSSTHTIYQAGQSSEIDLKNYPNFHPSASMKGLNIRVEVSEDIFASTGHAPLVTIEGNHKIGLYVDSSNDELLVKYRRANDTWFTYRTGFSLVNGTYYSSIFGFFLNQVDPKNSVITFHNE